MDSNLIKIFSKNRAEEYPEDVWGEYVLPPHYETINLFNYEKAVMIEGGRGSGKTMFLRYHCHDTRFSKKRRDVSNNELKKIGIYFRPDTHFCSSITSDVLGEDWGRVFSKYVLVSVLREFSRLVLNISKCTFSEGIENQEGLINLRITENINERLGSSLNTFLDLKGYSDKQLGELNDWVNDPDYSPRPKFPDMRSLVEALIDSIRGFSNDFCDTKFTLYIDEFENLTSEQQKLLNTWIKHGGKKLVLSAAYKQYGSVSRETTGDERLVLRNDYRTINLENYEEDDFRKFAAEILLIKLDGYVDDESLRLYKEMLCNENYVQRRINKDYSSETLTFARNFFPSISYEVIASKILEEITLRKRLSDFLMKPALLDSEFSADDYINDEYPVESIINGVLLNRKSQSAERVNREFILLVNSGKNDFYKPFKDVLVGGILWVYVSAGRRTAPIYSGFDRICLMARFNLRHFLDFCHQCLVERNRSQRLNQDGEFLIPVDDQALAARKNSELEVSKVVELGRRGNNLRFIVNRLGLFFQLLQKRKSQSEPEVVHFGIEVASMEQLPDNIQDLLNELKIWSVLIEYKGDTKRKSLLNFTSYEYMLHPMYSPNFLISFRKIRKHMFSVDDLNVIFSGTEEEFMTFCKPYAQRSFESSSRELIFANDIQGNLFDEI